MRFESGAAVFDLCLCVLGDGIRGSVLQAYHKFVRAMAVGRTRPVSTSGLRIAIGRHYPAFRDSDEFLLVLLDALDEGVNCSPKAKGSRRLCGLPRIALYT
jgi:hypothetical protein